MSTFLVRLLCRGALLGTLAVQSAFVSAADPLVIEMNGTDRGAAVWFAPVGVAVAAGTTVRFINRDTVNTHTATLYHPENGRPLRAPAAADSWDSGFLLPNQAFEVTLTEPGVYDFFCMPHEQAGMAGRIVVLADATGSAASPRYDDGSVPAAVLETLLPVERIVQERIIRPEQAE